MLNLLQRKLILGVLLAVVLYLPRLAFAAQFTSFYFTANQPPTREPGIQLWHSFYQWASKHPKQIQPLCLQKSFRCSVHLLAKPNEPARITTFISLRFFHLPDPYHFKQTKQGWEKIKTHDFF